MCDATFFEALRKSINKWRLEYFDQSRRGEDSCGRTGRLDWNRTGFTRAEGAKNTSAWQLCGMEKVKNSGNRRISKKLSNFIDDRDEFSVTIQHILRIHDASSGSNDCLLLALLYMVAILVGWSKLDSWKKFFQLLIKVSMPVSMFISTLLAKRCPNRLLHCLPSFFRNKKNLVLKNNSQPGVDEDDDVSDKEGVVDEAEKDALIAQKAGMIAQKISRSVP
uniref:Uncharacterized protein n=1 Tax=Ditylenchus dipsaci TaxID=166011 RepID=A0A915DCY6_9BILA